MARPVTRVVTMVMIDVVVGEVELNVSRVNSSIRSPTAVRSEKEKNEEK